MGDVVPTDLRVTTDVTPASFSRMWNLEGVWTEQSLHGPQGRDIWKSEKEHGTVSVKIWRSKNLKREMCVWRRESRSHHTPPSSTKAWGWGSWRCEDLSQGVAEAWVRQGVTPRHPHLGTVQVTNERWRHTGGGEPNAPPAVKTLGLGGGSDNSYSST